MIGIVLALMGLFGWLMGILPIEQTFLFEISGIIMGVIETIHSLREILRNDG